jgi:SAM-dependent methyltransferase
MTSPARLSAWESFWWRSKVTWRFVVSRFQKMPLRHPRVCNLCGYEGYFAPASRGTRVDARCPRCKSSERHRLFKLWLEANPGRIQGRNVLHFAPEKSMKAMIRAIAGTYRSADLTPGRADTVLNIEAIDLPDRSVDCVVCSHVLEHVNDIKALAEIHRVLKPGGLAAFMFPVVEGWSTTYENDAHVSRADRTLHYGQWDHLRMYGADVRDRIRAAGFELEEFTAEGPEVARLGLLRGEKVFLATRPG